MLYNSIPLYYTDVNSILVCGLPEDGEEFAKTFNHSVKWRTRRKKHTLAGKCKIGLAVFQFFERERFALVDF